MIARYTDHAANERTFLAWVRTAITIVGFGLAAARLSGASPPLWSEIAMLLIGGLVVFLAYLRLVRTRKRIASDRPMDDEQLPVDTLLLFLVAALFGLLISFAVHVGQ